MKKRNHKIMALLAMSFLWASSSSAQTVVDNLKYTLNSDGQSYAVTGFVEGITEANIPSEIEGKPVTVINKEVFKTASSLKSVKIPATVKTMGNSVFQGNASLETVVFEDGDTPLAVGGWTFNDCTAIKTILLPSRLSSFGANSNFKGCTSLTKVSFAEGCKLSDLKQYTFENCTALEEADLSQLKSLKVLPAGTFKNAGLKKILLPQDGALNKIQWDVFVNTPLESVELPATLNSIGARAFQNCSKLALVNVPAKVNSISPDAFGYTTGNTGVGCVVLNMQGGTWPSVDGNGNPDLTQKFLGADTRAYCYKNVTDIPEGVVKVAPIAAAKYTTYFCSTSAVALPEGVKAFTVSGIENNKLVLDTKVLGEGDVIPAGSPVLMQCAGDAPTLYPAILPDNTAAPLAPNLLKGSEEAEALPATSVNYTLVNNNGTYSFVKAETGENAANNAWLALDEAQAGNNASFLIDNPTSAAQVVITDNETDSKVYNLFGIEMDPENLAPGIYVKNGKKIMVRK